MMGVRHILTPETFVHRAIHAVAMLGLLLHLFLGCCAHHAHAGASEASSSPALAEPCCHHEPHGVACHGDSSPAHRACDEVACVFVRPDDTTSAGALARWCVSAQVACDAPHANLSASPGRAVGPASADALVPTTPPHLLYRVLLI